MFIDASAIVAVLTREPGFEELERRLNEIRGTFYVSPLVRYEATLALARAKSGERRPDAELVSYAEAVVSAFIEDIGAEEVSIDSKIGVAAIEASARYGKSVGHAADLNFGDCFAYACARRLGVGLIYKGSDFIHTDLA
ncbi:type II toxin-antitoxin system VapC family toxin [Aureimonas altamirensis]|uniref:type II toxin-antitoxin system VapC family toxin n=1 Tax=Aureimonas altamirensis TaxID=370622 RepID=UPI002036CAC0|nr:type II toxin-antitoxin system VapC family toxin [Aureimonas altamirensis]MCM2503934.1 type II toxin-antitoxin system VapC family toxin [Aureimonas altamirensis]